MGPLNVSKRVKVGTHGSVTQTPEADLGILGLAFSQSLTLIIVFKSFPFFFIVYFWLLLTLQNRILLALIVVF